MALETVTFPAVEVLRVGEWSAAKGNGTITAADLEAIVAASQDPEVDAAVVHVGHFDPRFDGEPALGRLTNLRIEGGTLLADQADTPATIAPILHKAWPRRSAELVRNHTTPSGKTYAMAMRGLGLLGVAKPAVKGLADVTAYFREYVALAEAAPAEGEFVALTIVDAPPDTDHRDQPHDPGGTMPLIDDLRAKLGLAADAPESDVLAAVAKATETATAADALLAEAATKVKDLEVALSAKDDATSAVALAKLERFEAALKERDDALVALTERLAATDRNKALDAAITDGRLTVAKRAEWEQRLAGPHADAFYIALSELPRAFAGLGGEVGTTALADGNEPTISDDAIAAFVSTIRK